MTTNDSVHACEICGESYKTYQALNAHKGQKHDTRAVIECRVCGSEFEVVSSEADSRYTCGKECKFIRQSDCRGAENNERYNERRRKKKKWYDERGIRCIGIEPDDVGVLEETICV